MCVQCALLEDRYVESVCYKCVYKMLYEQVSMNKPIFRSSFPGI